MLGVPSQPSNSHGSTKNAGTCAVKESDNGTMTPNQPKPACNGDQCNSPDKAHSQKNTLENGDTSAKEKDGFQPIKESNVTENGHETKSNIDAPVSQHGDTTRPLTVANRSFVEPPKVEKEEGELSPNRDFDESNIGDDEDSENRDHDDVSGSESAGDDDVSKEEHEEEDGEHDDDDDVDGKAESEGDAEDTNVVSGDGYYLRTAKPLAKCVPSSSCGVEKDCRVFYGNDGYYTLFRLH
ncbi:hypothetical protein M8C21_022909, partial [Ambrosia artemisiifolia]